MKRIVTIVSAFLILCQLAAAQSFSKIPARWKWLSSEEVAFSYDGSFNDAGCFSVSLPFFKKTADVRAPERFASFPINPEGAENLTYSPDSTKLAFTRAGNLWIADIATGIERRITSDGSDLILNGNASWVYYEEILGRASRYKAFWWSPDSQKLGFYRFDNSRVPMFPIYSAGGQDGSLRQTRYPKAGEPNPEVRIGIVDVSKAFAKKKWKPSVVWADFDEKDDQYFGIPFWGSDSRTFYIAREPRVQNTLDLYAVNVKDGSKTPVYHEEYPTWLEWIEEVIFTEDGLYMARSFETGWEQIYFLSYDGSTLRRLTDGENWRVHLVRVDGSDVYFKAVRGTMAKSALYKVSADGRIRTLTNPDLNVSGVSFSPDGKYFVASLSNLRTPTQIWIYETEVADLAWTARRMIESTRGTGIRIESQYASTCFRVAEQKGPDYNEGDYALPQLVTMTTEDGFELPATITYPKDFDPEGKYPVHVEIYGGPNTAYVRDSWSQPSEANQWWSENGIIHMVADIRASGHNGRAGLDQVHLDLTSNPIQDFVAWANWLKSKPYVIPDKIGVEGFSFGGTMTALLLLEHSDAFHYGIAGGGVYDWKLYDSHYTERFMDTPQRNPEGYKAASVLGRTASFPCEYHTSGEVTEIEPVRLKLTHGTGDDNVHFQNTLQLVDELQREGKDFELMIYPDGMHGYRGAQGLHSRNADREFWLKYLKGQR